MDFNHKKKLLEDTSIFSIRKQCELLGLSRASIYYTPVPMPEDNLRILEEIVLNYPREPWYGCRRLSKRLQKNGFKIGRDRVGKYMKLLGISAIYPKQKTTVGNASHKKYPYLLRETEIVKVNQVWSTDITYIKLRPGFCYLIAVIDWHSRFILDWRLSPTLDKEPCMECLQETLSKHPSPEVFNTDQGSQFTSNEFIEILLENGVEISMNGKGRSTDNAHIERFWRSLKCEEVYLKDYPNMKEAKYAIGEYINYYNSERLHQSLDYNTPEDIYFGRVLL